MVAAERASGHALRLGMLLMRQHGVSSGAAAAVAGASGGAAGGATSLATAAGAAARRIATGAAAAAASGGRGARLPRLPGRGGNVGGPSNSGSINSSSIGSQAWRQRAFTTTGASSSSSSSNVGGAAAAAASAGGAAARPKSLARRMRAALRDYKQLSKARLSALVVLTASAGFAAGSPGAAIDWAGLAWTSLGTFGAAAAANALNQVYEAANDARMARTCNRPLPAGRMGRGHAALFALACGAAGVWLLHEKANPLTAALGLANIALYAGVYTPLKQVTWLNTWVGAVVGAVPPLMGWAAAAGGLEPAAFALAAALFCWQMPHFLSLAWLCREDYARGGFRMLSMVDPTGRRTAGAALRHCAYLVPIGAAAVALGVASPWFAAESAALAAAMGAGAAAFYRAPSQGSARALFRGSLMHLPLLLACLAVHRQPNAHVTADEAAERLRAQWAAARSWLGATLGGGGGGSGSVVGWAEEQWWRAARAVGVADVKCPSRAFAEDGSSSSSSDGSSGDSSSSDSSSSDSHGNSSGNSET